MGLSQPLIQITSNLIWMCWRWVQLRALECSRAVWAGAGRALLAQPGQEKGQEELPVLCSTSGGGENPAGAGLGVQQIQHWDVANSNWVQGKNESLLEWWIFGMGITEEQSRLKLSWTQTFVTCLNCTCFTRGFGVEISGDPFYLSVLLVSKYSSFVLVTSFPF